MAENSSNGASSMASAPTRSDDPAWAHRQVVIGVKNSSICVHCSERINGGGITRLKYHLAEDLTMEKEKRKRLRIDIGNSQSLSNDEVKKGDNANPTLSDIGSQVNKRLIMQGTNGWSNRRNVPIVNFLAYSPRGTIFLKSVDTSGLRKDKETLLEMCDEVAKEMGQENIVQFVSDNESAFKTAGFTTKVLALLRKDFTNKNDLCHPGITGLVPDRDTQDVISSQLEEYKKAISDFGMLLAIRQREKLNPKPSLLNGDDISWETIEAPLSTLTLEDEETCFDEENELGGNDQLLECLVDEFPYIPPQD
ncbi:hypothetical protein POTOM_002152 [Populus tomentosa]|uniref:BED-type domain-containing protein n=1 Tax=Populus tomentosa TaxID=118781 RepID=A0A8X8DJ47_POPTO|nr:hypothetical protein POTOM_002152 [Populus tomentosa]